MKKALATLLAFALIVTGLLAFNPSASKAEAATSTTENGNFVAVAKDNWNDSNQDGVPELDGYLFAGYYKNADCAKANRASASNATHAKFVVNDMLDVKVSVTNGVVQKSDVVDKDGNKVYENKYVIRFISSVESLNYKNIGFEVEYTNGEGEVVKARNTTSKVFKNIDSTTGAANGAIDKYEFSPKVVGEDSEYFMTAKLPVENTEEGKAVTYKVRAFWTTFDGTEVMGKTRCVSVNDSANDIVNMTAEADAQLTEGTDYTATYGPNADGTGASAVKVEVLSCDANGHANIRVTLANGDTATGLKSATKFIIKDAEGNQVATAVYRNYYTDKAGTADTSWWDVDPTATRFEIASVSDLYGLASLVNGKKDLFYQNEIHLVRSVEVNEGLAIPASESADGVATWKSDTTPVAWTPIGNGWNADFRGIFDGDNNTISGLYYDGTSFAGLFGYVGINNKQRAEISNVRLTNSYFATTKAEMASIVAYGYAVGRLENVYSDAVLVSKITSGALVGGMIGKFNPPSVTIMDNDAKVEALEPELTMKNCWFDGEINMYASGSQDAGGMIGATSGTYRINMENCLNSGTINSKSTSGYIGGLYGRNINPTWLDIQNCLVTGEMNVANTSGGLFGVMQHNTLGWLDLSNCYTTQAKAWGNNAFTQYKADDCLKTTVELASANVNTIFPGNNGAWENDVEDAQTPILSSFADWWKEKQYEAGLDTSWYDADATEYVITTAKQLNGLAELAKENTFAGKTIKLGANIALNKADSATVKKWVYGTAIPENMWTPICRTKEFAGIFDGQGHTISGLYYNGDLWNVGLFGSTAEGGVIKNVKVIDSYFKSSGGYVGGVVGLNKSSTLENLYSNAIVDCTYGQAGGIVGCQYGAKGGSTADYFTDGTGTKWSIKNVWFEGEVISYSGKNYYGGIVGALPNQIILTVENALFTGKITGTGAGFVGGIVGGNNNASTVTLNNCLALGSIQDGAGSATALYGKVNSRYTKLFVNHSYTTISNYNTIASPYGDGSLTTSEGLVMLQTRDALISANEDTLLPMLEGETENAWVSDNATGWNDTDRGTPILASFAEWWIKNVEHDELTVDFSWYNDNDTEFTLYDAGDLAGLAYLVNNTDEQFAEKTIKLGANIQVNKVNDEIFASWKTGAAFGDEWTPIGTDAKPFAGTFDGQEYEISGLYYNGTKYYIGLFGKTAQQSVIRNIRVVDSYFKTSGNAVGAIAGAGDSLIMENLYSNAYVYGTTGVSGGLIGRISGTSGGAYADYYTNGTGTKWTVRNAWFDGELEVPSVDKYYFGGVVGQLPNPIVLSLENCLFTGQITGGTGAKFVGGIVGGNNNYLTCKMYNCLSVGTMETGAASGSALYGYFNSSRSKLYVYDSYTTITNYNSVASITNTTYQIVETSEDIVKTRPQLINAEATALFPALAGETKSAWVNDIGYNATDRGTPILASFAEWWLARQPETELAERADTTWYNDNDTEFILDSAAELLGFAQLSQTNDFAEKTIKLGKDIVLNDVKADTVQNWIDGTVSANNLWTPVGASKAFAGTFDGQGHSIIGLYISGSANVGFFANMADTSKVYNLKLVDGYYKNTGNYTGGLCAVGSPLEVKNVYINAYIEARQLTGGFFGHYREQADNTRDTSYVLHGTTQILDGCWFDGELVIADGQGFVGGFIGRTVDFVIADVTNCLFTGKITASNAARVAKFYGHDWSSVQFNIKNSLFAGELNATNCTLVGEIGGNQASSVTVVTVENSYATGDTAFGKVASAGKLTIPSNFLQSRSALATSDEVDLFPALEGETDNAWVNDNENGWNDTDRGTPILATFAEWWIENVKHDELTVDFSWYDEDATEITLTTADQFYSFAQLAKTKNFAGQTVKLGANIVLNEVDETILTKWEAGSAMGRTWTPIGTAAKPFAGTFDGQGNTISGLYLNTTASASGVFGTTAATATIQNFKLIDSYMKSTGDQFGLIGDGTFAKIENVYTNAIMCSEGNHVGGFIGRASGSGAEMIISNCWFDGTITQTADTANSKGTQGGVSGFVGMTAQTTGTRPIFVAQNCLNTGSQSGYTRVGGFIGWHAYGNKEQDSTWANCLMVGSAESDVSGTACMFIGEAATSGKTIITNTYTTGTVLLQGGSDSYVTYNQDAVKSRVDLYLADLATLFSGSTAWVQDSGYNDVDRGTPILATFAEWWIARQDEGALEVAPSTAWYTGDEPVISNKGDLLGFLALSEQGETFDGKTIKLGANIILNKPNVSEWKAGTDVPTYPWTPVTFNGNFDGQGHSISGIYVKSSSVAVGFFGKTAAGSSISNFRLLDSYVEQSYASGTWSHFTGSIVGDAAGDITNVYSNATMVSPCHYTSGIVGIMRPASVEGETVAINNCWFDGTIELTKEVGYIGGIVGYQENGTLNLTNVLYTGHIKGNRPTADKYGIGGIIGQTYNTVTATNLESVVSAGTFDIPNGTSMIGSVVGYFYSGVDETDTSTYTLNNVFANRGWGTTSSWGGGNGTLTGQVIQTSNGDRLIGYVPQVARDIKNDNLLDAQKLDFTSAWTMRTNDVPIPTALKDVVDVRTIVSDATIATLTNELGLGTISGSLSNAVAEGAGDYVVTVTGTKTTYDSYLQFLNNEANGFKPQASNVGTPMEADGVYSATYYKTVANNLGEWVVNVTFVTNDGKIYVSLNSDVDSMAKTLVDDDAKNPIGTDTGTNAVALSMVEDKEAVNITGNCFVFQLPNGHFIINDGNTDNGSGAILKAYLQSQVGEGNPIYIDAWTISHFHNDHAGALMDFAKDASLRENVYLNALYANEPSAYGATIYETRTIGDINGAIQGAKLLTKSPTDNSAPDFYEVHMGQRYYFNGLTMDIINTPEQIAVDTWTGGDKTVETHTPDPFNTSSVNFVFTLNETGKRVLIGGDSTKITMQYIIDAYGENNNTLANINVFAAYHHGKNAMNQYNFNNGSSSYPTSNKDGYVNAGKANTGWADFLLNNSNNESDKFDVMLFPFVKKFSTYKHTSTSTEDYYLGQYRNVYVGDDGSVIYPWNIGEINADYANRSDLHLTVGYEDSTSATDANPHGTVKITFNANDTISWTAFNSVHGQETYTFTEFASGSAGTATPDTDL